MPGFGRLATAPPIDEGLVDERLPIWRALADLYLDTWFDPDRYDQIARVLLESHLSRSDLERVFLNEVTPAFAPNIFLDIAGEWAGWPDDFIRETIRACLANGPSRLLPTRSVMQYAQKEWSKVAAALDRANCR